MIEKLVCRVRGHDRVISDELMLSGETRSMWVCHRCGTVLGPVPSAMEQFSMAVTPSYQLTVPYAAILDAVGALDRIGLSQEAVILLKFSFHSGDGAPATLAEAREMLYHVRALKSVYPRG